jgi:hypothetical protein
MDFIMDFHKIIWMELAQSEKTFLFLKHRRFSEAYIFSQASYYSAKDNAIYLNNIY